PLSLSPSQVFSPAADARVLMHLSVSTPGASGLVLHLPNLTACSVHGFQSLHPSRPQAPPPHTPPSTTPPPHHEPPSSPPPPLHPTYSTNQLTQHLSSRLPLRSPTFHSAPHDLFQHAP